ncbi:glutamate--tRNA ligase [Marinococcus luteus]|uniref:glutamate--tRNA ligase n=1 Tax=Marinococcus luteus TaxID=1122204 RepID=UPI002ACC7152|nr:glutamate--tRNA ligase [Marinococcus luteus]MDZ5784544.1 glutamate--tRNA ligase [Marinococcus luteus]
MSEKVRVRFAPSPTGHLHIGGARSALFNYLFARNQGGDFILRIEDTDQERNVEDATARLMESLRWLGIEWDESVDVGGPHAPYQSMERIDLYKEYVQRLLDEGKAYYDYMTEEELAEEREEQMARGEAPKYSGRDRDLTPEQRKAYEDQGIKPVVRFRVPEGQSVIIDDVVRGNVIFESNDIGDFVIARKDGIPTYNFAVVIDDHLMEISHVIRAEEHLSNTPRQALVYDAFDWEKPRFAHASLILNPNRQKMSKRDGSVIQFVEQYRDLGYLPEAIVNFLALLGWSPKGEEELFTIEELKEQFSLERVSKAPAVFDTDKLAWMNNQYVKEVDTERLTLLALPHLQEAGKLPAELSEDQYEWLKQLVGIYQEQMHYAAEIVDLTDLFFKTEIDYTQEAREVLEQEHVSTVLQHFSKELDEAPDFEPETVKKAVKATQKATGYKGKQLFMPVRVATTGQTHGPELPVAISLLGRNVVQARLQQVLSS